jgi:hypothetical protein
MQLGPVAMVGWRYGGGARILHATRARSSYDLRQPLKERRALFCVARVPQTMAPEDPDTPVPKRRRKLLEQNPITLVRILPR